MVQISRKTLTTKSRAIRSGVLGLLRFVAVTAVIPALFFVRHYWIANDVVGTVTDPLGVAHPQQTLRKSPTETSAAATEVATSIATEVATADASTTSANIDTDTVTAKIKEMSVAAVPANAFAFLSELDTQVLDSDVAQLDYCHLSQWKKQHLHKFTVWARPLLNATLTAVLVEAARHQHQQNPSASTSTAATVSAATTESIQQELVLELLELYGMAHQLCDYTTYQPTVPSDTVGLLQASTKLRAAAEQLSFQESPPQRTRLAVVIVAFQDAAHLQRLVDAVILPQHYVIVHLDRRVSPEYAQEVQRMTGEYDNVVVVQFGSVVYKTDSVSLINLRIMRWLQQDLELPYDYHVTLGGAAYPLQTAQQLAAALPAQGRAVWLGELTHKGVRVDAPQDSRLRRKRLVVTRGLSIPVYMKRLPSATFAQESFSSTIVDSMTRKSVSGNQAVFSYETVRELLDSPDVMELFSRSKYGCCCCLEERNWIAALTMIGLQQEALEQAGMWQVWGGAETCQSSMKNAILNRNASMCFRLEDATMKQPKCSVKATKPWTC